MRVARGKAQAIVSFRGASTSTLSTLRTCSVASPRRPWSSRAQATAPLPSKRLTSSPTRTRTTFSMWCASSPRSVNAAPAWGSESTKNRRSARAMASSSTGSSGRPEVLLPCPLRRIKRRAG